MVKLRLSLEKVFSMDILRTIQAFELYHTVVKYAVKMYDKIRLELNFTL